MFLSPKSYFYQVFCFCDKKIFSYLKNIFQFHEKDIIYYAILRLPLSFFNYSTKIGFWSLGWELWKNADFKWFFYHWCDIAIKFKILQKNNKHFFSILFFFFSKTCKHIYFSLSFFADVRSPSKHYTFILYI